MSRYTPKQIAKYQRQKYIGYLEKIIKNLFRLFRDSDINAEKFGSEFDVLMSGLADMEHPRIDSEYMRLTYEYTTNLHKEIMADDFDDDKLHKIRDIEIANLNRLRKLKNSLSYKKEKHKHKQRDQDWGTT